MSFSPLEAGLYILLVIPTLMALIGGAPFVPTPMERCRKMLSVAKVKKGEKVYDCGCGDGRTVYLAANEFGAEAFGIELSPLVYFWARIRKLFWRSRADISFGNLWWHSFTDADVVAFYLMPEMMERIAVKLEKELKPGARVVSYAFPVKRWKPVAQIPRDHKKGHCPIWVYEME